MQTMTYEVADRVARITLNRPERGNGLTPTLIAELAACVERADLDPAVHVILLAGNGKGFCGGYDLVDARRGDGRAGEGERRRAPPARRWTRWSIAANHDPRGTWDPMVDHAMMSRNVRAFMIAVPLRQRRSSARCTASASPAAPTSRSARDLLVIAARREDRLPARARVGLPDDVAVGAPARPAARQAAAVHRRLPVGRRGARVGARDRGAAAPSSSTSAPRRSSARIARMPLNQLQMMKLLVNQQLYAQGLPATQLLGTVFDGIARHTAEGYAFQQQRGERGLPRGGARARRAVRRRGRRAVGHHELIVTLPFRGLTR